MSLRRRLSALKAWVRARRTSSAREFVDRLGREGVEQADIRAEHLLSLYESLRPTGDRPDFGSIDGLLGDLPAAEEVDGRRDLWGVLVETREHPALSLVIDNVISRLDIPVQVFCTEGNEGYIGRTDVQGHVESGKVILTRLNAEKMLGAQYNALLLSPRFWDAIRGRRKLLFFQTDSLLCPGSPYSIHEFTHCDYIGAYWETWRPVGLRMHGGCGGLSIRDWRRSQECLRRFPPENWPAGEDGYYAFHMDLIGARVGRGLECGRFATQDAFLCRSLGVHQPTCLSPEERAAFLRYCPEAAQLLPGA